MNVNYSEDVTSWALVATLIIAVAIPPLLSIHTNPQTVFFNEWATCFGLLALLTLSGLAIEKCAVRPSAAFNALAGFSCWVSLVFAIHEPSGFFSATGVISYALMCFCAWLALQALVGLRRRGSTVTAVVVGMIFCALSQATVSVLQLNGLSLGGVIMPKLYNSVYGNIAQPNHFGNLLWLGQVSLVYLWGTRRVPASVALGLTATISLFAALSASRAVWLYTLAFPLVAGAYAWKREDENASRMGRAAAIVSAVSVAMQLFVAFSSIKTHLGVVSSISRADDAGSNTQRLFDWMVAWKTSLAYPWTGAGLGSFSWQTALHSIGLPPPAFIRIAENAHDTPLHFLAELGWPFMLVMFALCAIWLWRRWRAPASAETLWGLGIITVIGAHSLVEYPLWYTYFLIPFGFAVAVVDAGDTRLPVIRFSSRWLLIPAALLAIGLAWSLRDYKLVEQGYADFRFGDDPSMAHYEESRTIVAKLSRWSLFAVHARALQIRAWPIDDLADAPEVVRLCDQTLHAKPTFQSLTQCGFAYAALGREAEAVQASEIVCGAYPAIYHGDFGAEMADVFRHHGWRITPQMYCVKPEVATGEAEQQ